MVPPSFWRRLSCDGLFAESDAQGLLSASLLITLGSSMSAFIGAGQAQLPWQSIH